eukprot:1195599-Prorocentrum_minimum.AAC.2
MAWVHPRPYLAPDSKHHASQQVRSEIGARADPSHGVREGATQRFKCRIWGAPRVRRMINKGLVGAARDASGGFMW